MVPSPGSKQESTRRWQGTAWSGIKAALLEQFSMGDCCFPASGKGMWQLGRCCPSARCEAGLESSSRAQWVWPHCTGGKGRIWGGLGGSISAGTLPEGQPMGQEPLAMDRQDRALSVWGRSGSVTISLQLTEGFLHLHLIGKRLKQERKQLLTTAGSSSSPGQDCLGVFCPTSSRTPRKRQTVSSERAGAVSQG